MWNIDSRKCCTAMDIALFMFCACQAHGKIVPVSSSFSSACFLLGHSWLAGSQNKEPKPNLGMATVYFPCRKWGLWYKTQKSHCAGWFTQTCPITYCTANILLLCNTSREPSGWDWHMSGLGWLVFWWRKITHPLRINSCLYILCLCLLYVCIDLVKQYKNIFN